ncbi:hypothetical protein D3C71_1822670 [compost metagenome]
MLPGQTCLQTDQPLTTGIEAALKRATHAHVQIIQPLGLLAQTFAGMTQAARNAFQA